MSIFPLVDVKVFDEARKINVSKQNLQKESNKVIQDTVIIPAQEEGFKDVFLGENRWYAIRIGGGKLNEIKYIAAYQSAPISAITHFAEVDSIQAYGDGGKYLLNFKSPAKEIGPIRFGNAKAGSMQSPRYTDINTLLKAKAIKDIF